MHVASAALIALGVAGCTASFGFSIDGTTGSSDGAHASAGAPKPSPPRDVDAGVGGDAGESRDGGVADAGDAGVENPNDAGASTDAAPPEDAAVPGVVACRDAVPDPPPESTPAGTASGTFLAGEGDAHPIAYKSAVYLPQPGTDALQVVVSDDPDLCGTLSRERQAPMCSLDPARSPDVVPYAYLSTIVPATSSGHTSVGRMAFYRGSPSRMITPEVDGQLVVNEATSGASTPLTGEFYLCDGAHSIASSGTFSAQYCPTAAPICH